MQVIIERYAWSGTTYSWASDPSADPRQYMILDAGLPQPDLGKVWKHPFPTFLNRGGIAPSLFVDIEFQQKLRTCYADPRIWKGINVVMHETQMNRWASRKALIRRIQGELLLRSQPKSWVYLSEQIDICSACGLEVNPRQPVFRCFRCTKLIHFVCFDGEFNLTKDSNLSSLCIGISSRNSGRRASCFGPIRGEGRGSRATD